MSETVIRGASRPLETSAREIVVVSPDWSRPQDWLPALSTYIAFAPADGDTCLCLDARDVGPMTWAVREIVAYACRYLAGDEDFAEVLLVEDDVQLPRAVSDANELVERLRLRPRALAARPGAIAAHARWAKVLADRVRDRWAGVAFDLTPAPDATRDPLVTVRIPTYGSVDLLLERALPSVLNGSYENIEVLVCSDGPQPHARAAVEAIDDPRLRYLELPERPAYPQGARAFWRTAGIEALNHSLDVARGDFIAPLDHDDAYTRHHIANLLEAVERSGADFVFGRGMMEHEDGYWTSVGGMPLQHGGVLHGAVMYSSRLAHYRYDRDCWLIDEPGDWNLWRRMAQAEAHVVHLDEPVVMHFREGSSMSGRDKREAVEEVAEDILATPARELLTIASPEHGVWREGESRARASSPPPARRTERRLAVLDTTFPWSRSGFRHNEARELLRRRPDTVFFTQHHTPEMWEGPVYPLRHFDALAAELGITDVYAVFANFVAGLLGLDDHPDADTVGHVVREISIADTLERRGMRFHSTVYPGGGLMPVTSQDLLGEIARRSATVFSNAAEVLDAVPDAKRVPVPMETDFYSFRPRVRGPLLRAVFAADAKPRKGLAVALAALERLDGEVHLDVVGPRRHLNTHTLPPGITTFHEWLPPERLREIYWGADVFVSPVSVEGPDAPKGEVGVIDGFPTTAASEALASGCALISSNPRGEDWLLRPGEHYLEIPMHDPDALAAALLSLAADRAERDRLARVGAHRLREIGDVRHVVAAKLAAMGLA
jgi:glycosyltransferase involved in cell wall biosynthesis